MQIKKILSMGERLWNPYFVAGVIAIAFIVIKLPIWSPWRELGLRVPSFHFTVWIQGAILIAFVFLVGYCLLKPFETLVFWKFAIYLVVLTYTNWLLFRMPLWDIDWLTNLVSDHPWFSGVILPFLASTLLNIGFLKYLFQINTRSAILLGILIGMVDAQIMEMGGPIY